MLHVRMADSRMANRWRGLAVISALIVFIGAAAPVSAENWPAWRGPAGTGISGETELPVAWNLQRGLVWKAELPAWGTSTPCIWGDAVFVTSHREEDQSLLLLKIKKATGEIEWTKTVGKAATKRVANRTDNEQERREQRFHETHNLATPSPVTNGSQVAVHFGNGDLAAYDFAGEERWRRNLQEDFGTYTVWNGHANSPLLYENLLISVCMQDSLADISSTPVESYVVAHDVRTGRRRWKTPRMTGARAEQNDAYTTPVLRKTDGKVEVVVMGGNQLDAYDPATGKQVWVLPGLIGGRTVSGPTLGGELIYVTHGGAGPLLAIRAQGQGPLPKKSIVWKYEQSTPDSPTPVVWGDLLFSVTDGGVALCLDAHRGTVKWKERLPGDYKASPVAAGGRIYFLNLAGVCTVVAASPRFHRLAVNDLEADTTIASPAISEGRIYIRSRNALYCVGKQ